MTVRVPEAARATWSSPAVALRIDPSLSYEPSAYPVLKAAVADLLGLLAAQGQGPLGDLVRPGDTVVIKPNLVYHAVSDQRAALTNGQIVRAVCDLVLAALEGRGQVVIADVPLQSARWPAVIALNGLDRVVADYQRLGAPVSLLDLRQEWLEVVDGIHRQVHRLAGDPDGYRVVNLGEASALEPLGSARSRFAVGDYDRDSTARYHMSTDRNEYLIPQTILNADVLINLPKMKTHKKSGITCALKNLVGTCGHKSYLPHFRLGGPGGGGDEFAISHPIKVIQRNAIDVLKGTSAPLYRFARRIGRMLLHTMAGHEPAELRTVMAGSWYGNDTLWRTILDLNRIARYADRDGQLRDVPQRRYLCVVDGVWTGEGDGPMEPDPRHDGVLLASTNPVLADLVVTWLMGIDPAAIRQVAGAFELRTLPLVEGTLDDAVRRLPSLVAGWTGPLPDLRFRLPPGWEGYVGRRAAS